MVSRPAEWRSCLIESAHLVLGQPLGLFQPWMLGLKSNTLRTGGGGGGGCGGDVRTSVGGVVVGGLIISVQKCSLGRTVSLIARM